VAGIGIFRQVTHLTTACTRPATRIFSCTIIEAGGRVMPGVRTASEKKDEVRARVAGVEVAQVEWLNQPAV